MRVAYIREDTTTNEGGLREPIFGEHWRAYNPRREPNAIRVREVATLAVLGSMRDQSLHQTAEASQQIRSLSSSPSTVRDSKTMSGSSHEWPIDIAVEESRVSSRLKRLASLEYDWDAYGARPVSRRALVMAERIVFIVQRLMSGFVASAEPTVLGARADGGILAEWTGEDWSFELHFEPDGTMGYLVDHGETGGYSEVDSASLGAIVNALLTLLSE